MSSTSKKLLVVTEFLAHAKLPKLYQRLGFDVTNEWQVRKAISLLRKIKPDVVVADFYHQADFRDRLSNLESLLATAQPMAETKILVLYEPENQAVLDKVRARMRIDAVLTMPVKEEELQSILKVWL
jgi:AmiR/NasT family two-component response regulator